MEKKTFEMITPKPNTLSWFLSYTRWKIPQHDHTSDECIISFLSKMRDPTEKTTLGCHHYISILSKMKEPIKMITPQTDGVHHLLFLVEMNNTYIDARRRHEPTELQLDHNSVNFTNFQEMNKAMKGNVTDLASQAQSIYTYLGFQLKHWQLLWRMTQKLFCC